MNNKNFTLFIAELGKYFMEFLETDFHKRRIPKRNIKYKDSNNLLLGVNLRKYESFQKDLSKLVVSGFPNGKVLTIKKNKYVTKISRNSLNILDIQLGNINSDDIDDTLNSIKNIILANSSKYQKQPETGLTICEEEISSVIRDNFITPLVTSIESTIETQSLQGIDALFNIEENLLDILLKPLTGRVSELYNSHLIRNEPVEAYALAEVLDKDFIISSISDYFKSFLVDDLYNEIQQLFNNKNILDKKTIYLYICDINYNNNRYPIFYIPIEVTKLQASFRLSFDSSIYINKKAIGFIVEKYNSEKGVRGKISSIDERILYLGDYDDSNPIINYLQTIVGDLLDHFSIPESIDLKDIPGKSTQSLFIQISYSLNICIFDKSDEALINDYEELLELLFSGNEISEFFSNLISNFIMSDPKSIISDIEDDWNKIDTDKKLVPICPIPMNREQRLILNAINHDKGKYILVDGPPGTGKSHTITSIVFQHILENKSILVLSDKKEALDVVEDKITSVLNNVRHEENFQNPILRLGKTGNTYSKILSTTSLNNIKRYYNATKKYSEDWEKDLKDSKVRLSDWIIKEININNKISIEDLYDFSQLQSRYLNEKDYDLDEFLQKGGSTEIVALRNSVVSINEIFKDPKVILNGIFDRYNLDVNNPTLVKSIFQIIELVKSTIKDFRGDISSVKLFNTISTNQLEELYEQILFFTELKSGVFGLLFKKKKIALFNQNFINTFSFKSQLSPSDTFNSIRTAYSVLNSINKGLLEKHQIEIKDIDGIEIAHFILSKNIEICNRIDSEKEIDSINVIQNFIKKYPNNANHLELNANSFSSYWNNRITLDSDLHTVIRKHIDLDRNLSEVFNGIPVYDFKYEESHIENLLTQQMSQSLDRRVIDFAENNQGTKQTLKLIIRRKKKFPRNEFEKLKNAFPCIICGIRDYAEYIPLESELFDLIIIDEASQVSMAQALPALFRGKKIVVFGDNKQFSNVKSALARTDTNKTYLNTIQTNFKKNISDDISAIMRLEHFNIKTSILDFFEYIANSRIILLKHFRGYREHISYSNKYFYDNALQAIRIRTKPIKDIIKFSFIEHDEKAEVYKNTNLLEAQYIINEIEKISSTGKQLTVGIITPHTNQVRLIKEELNKNPNSEKYYKNLKLKIMTFDTCQGEERDYIFYSMVATREEDKLWAIFIKDLKSIDLETGGAIKAQRLNVGFSRVKECMHFILSKPIEEFSGSIRDALLHYQQLHNSTKEAPNFDDTDKNSPMEKKVLNWILSTPFYLKYSDSIKIVPQFPIGEYLKQLDPYYSHPMYKTDFLFSISHEVSGTVNIIIEYDGFVNHFKDFQDVNEINYNHYYNESDVERQKILEGYGYKFIRLNRFNTKSDPVDFINHKIESMLKKKVKTIKV